MRTRRDLQHRRSSIAAISTVLAMLVISRPLHAQSADAEALFDAGNRLMTEHKLAQACEAFEASNRVESRAGTLIRLGECREQNRELASAWSAYRDALSRVKDPRKREYATARAAAMEAVLSYFTVSVAGDSKVDGLAITRNGKPLEPTLWNRALPVDGGDYVIVARAPGHDDWQATASIAVERANVTLEVPRLKDRRVTPPPSPPATPHTLPMKLPPAEPVPTPSPFTTQRKIAIGLGAASAVAVVAGAVLGAGARAKQDDAFRLCPEPTMPCDAADESNALIQASHRRALEANVAFGVAAAAAIGAGVLWFTGGPNAENRLTSVVPSVAPGEASIAIQRRF